MRFGMEILLVKLSIVIYNFIMSTRILMVQAYRYLNQYTILSSSPNYAHYMISFNISLVPASDLKLYIYYLENSIEKN